MECSNIKLTKGLKECGDVSIKQTIKQTKSIMTKMIKSLPKEANINNFVFCSSHEYDYGRKQYKGVNLYYYIPLFNLF